LVQEESEEEVKWPDAFREAGIYSREDHAATKNVRLYYERLLIYLTENFKIERRK
jgi:hypothetical protein